MIFGLHLRNVRYASAGNSSYPATWIITRLSFSHNLYSLSRTTVSDHCLGPLSRTTVSDHCLGPLSRTTVSDHSRTTLGPLSDHHKSRRPVISRILAVIWCDV
jgi:hypothetical protein